MIAACVAAVLSACNFLGSNRCGNNHEFGEVIEVTAPTCIEGGTGKRVCAVCGYEKSGFVLKSKGHDFGKKVIEKVIGHTMLLMYPMTVVLRVMLSIP